MVEAGGGGLLTTNRRRLRLQFLFYVCVCFIVRALELHRQRQMRRLSLRPGEAAVLAQALVLWAADACVYTAQKVRRRRSLGAGRVDAGRKRHGEAKADRAAAIVAGLDDGRWALDHRIRQRRYVRTTSEPTLTGTSVLRH